jgi:hypothetical protein
MIEIVKVLGKQAEKDASRRPLFLSYLKIAKPRLAAIYADWDQRA